MSFAKWIKRYEKEESDIGNLARTIARDSRFPKFSCDKKHIKDYLWSRNACSDALTAFENAWRRYERMLDAA